MTRTAWGLDYGREKKLKSNRNSAVDRDYSGKEIASLILATITIQWKVRESYENAIIFCVQLNDRENRHLNILSLKNKENQVVADVFQTFSRRRAPKNEPIFIHCNSRRTMRDSGFRDAYSVLRIYVCTEYTLQAWAEKCSECISISMELSKQPKILNIPQSIWRLLNLCCTWFPRSFESQEFKKLCLKLNIFIKVSLPRSRRMLGIGQTARLTHTRCTCASECCDVIK